MKIIVLYQSKEKNETWRESSGYSGATCGGAESVMCSRKHWFFSGAFSSGAAIRPLWCGCPGFSKYLKKPAWELAVLSLSRCKNRTGGVGAGFCLDGWQSTASSLAAQHNQGYHLKFLVVFATFLSTMSWPTGVIRYSKFSKQFSVFSVYMLGFIMVCGQKRFSTSRTLKLVHFLFLASLCSVGPTQTAALKCSVQPYHDRTEREAEKL